jgi:hypothetical protein
MTARANLRWTMAAAFAALLLFPAEALTRRMPPSSAGSGSWSGPAAGARR